MNILITIGTNLRYEASLLNTRLRRKQSTTNIIIMTISAYNVLHYSQRHQGNSYKSLIARIENRLSFVKKELKSNDKISIFIGINNRRNRYGTFRQKVVLQLGKTFFIKTTKRNRLGFIHSSVGSLAFSHMGYNSKIKNKKNIQNIFVGIPTEINISSNNY